MLAFNNDYPPVLLKKYLCPLRSFVTKQRRFVMLMLSHSFCMQKFPDLKPGGEKNTTRSTSSAGHNAEEIALLCEERILRLNTLLCQFTIATINNYINHK